MVGVSLCGNLLAQATLIPITSDLSQQNTKQTRASIPSPMLSAHGKISVGCHSAERADYRWPILKFADTTMTNFEKSFVPVGSIDSPLYIAIGISTDDKDTHVTRRVLRIGSSFSQLVVGVPNPDAVDLDLLRVSIVEALLRETCRTQKGQYAHFAWPRWFVKGMTYASFGTVWKAQAYEVVYQEYEAGTLPTLESLFNDEEVSISDEAAAFFAMWVMESASKEERRQRIAAAWTPEEMLGGPLTEVKESAWLSWIEQQSSTVFVPGSITARHFERWHATLVAPTTRDEVLRLTDYLTKSTIGRPQLFRDLTVLYLEAYLAWLQNGDEAYAEKRQKADEAAQILKDHLTRNPILVDEATSPYTGVEGWQPPNEIK